jgi:hypothetical protein
MPTEEWCTPAFGCQVRSAQSPNIKSLKLSARGCCALSCTGHLTATTVRVGVLVPGVINGLPFLKPGIDKSSSDSASEYGGGPKR